MGQRPYARGNSSELYQPHRYQKPGQQFGFNIPQKPRGNLVFTEDDIERIDSKSVRM